MNVGAGFRKFFHCGQIKSMPKHPKNKNNAEKEKSNQPYSDSAVALDKNGNIRLKVFAKPGAKINAITSFGEEGVEIQINAPPVDGEANAELIRYISQLLELRKSDVELNRGSHSRYKTVLITRKTFSVEEIETKLKHALECSNK